MKELQDYEWIDGEMVAGLVLGWNFGDGHLHREQLLRAVQAQCSFRSGRASLHHGGVAAARATDIALPDLGCQDRPFGRGYVDVNELRARQPWSEVGSG